MTVISELSALSLPHMNTPALETWSYTKVNVVKFSHVWTIINFSFLLEENGQYLSSPIFSAGDNDDNKWQLRIYPKGSSESVKDHVGIFLHLESSNQSNVSAISKYYIIDSENKRTNAMDSINIDVYPVGGVWGYRTFINRNDLLTHASKLLPNDKLTVLCEITAATGGITNISGPNDTMQFEVPERQLSKHLEILFENEKMTDVTIVTRGKEFPAHKTILAARSPVFASMFVHKTNEEEDKRVEIADLEEEVVREMLRFIYTETTTNLDKLAKGLLAAADKYVLEELKMMCEQEISKTLSIENAAELLILAEEFNAAHLHSNVVDFINRHAKDVMDTAGFKSMADSHPQLAAEVLRAFLAYFKKE